MTAKQTLDAYQDALHYTQRCFAELNDARRGGVRSPYLDGAPRGTGFGSGLERQIEKIDDLEHRAAKARGKALDLAEEVCKMIDDLDDYNEKAVIRLRYLRGYSWEKIARTINYSEQHAIRFHTLAIKKLDKLRA